MSTTDQLRTQLYETCKTACETFLIGEKYHMDDPRGAAYDVVRPYVFSQFAAFNGFGSQTTNAQLDVITVLWAWVDSRHHVQELIDMVLEKLVRASAKLCVDASFQELLCKNEKLMLDYVQALAGEIARKTSNAGHAPGAKRKVSEI